MRIGDWSSDVCSSDLWEGDLLCGSSNSHIVTLVERHSRYVMLAKVPNRDSRSVISALIEQARSLPDELCRSLTWDRGKEMAEHKGFTLATDVAVYFCDPHSPWQRGSNRSEEHTSELQSLMRNTYAVFCL